MTLSLPGNRLVGADGGSNDKPEGVIMRLYESVLIARQDITAAQVETMAPRTSHLSPFAHHILPCTSHLAVHIAAASRQSHFETKSSRHGGEPRKQIP